MNFSKTIFKIFPKSRTQLIETLEFRFFLFEINRYLVKQYSKRKNPSIKFFLKILKWWERWESKQVEEYYQLLFDYPYWELRQYYNQCVQEFISNELSNVDFIGRFLYPSLSNRREALELVEDYRRQATIELDPKSFGFSKIISDLTPVLEGFESDPEESFFTEEEFCEIIQNLAIQLEKYSIE